MPCLLVCGSTATEKTFSFLDPARRFFICITFILGYILQKYERGYGGEEGYKGSGLKRAGNK